MLPPPLLARAAEQHGVFSAEQANHAGLSSSQLSHRTRSGLLHRSQLGVYVLAGTPDTWHREVMAAVLSIPGSLASHRTAAALHHLDGFWKDNIELVTEHGRWRRKPVLLHQTKDLVAADIAVVDGIPSTSLIRTLVDLPAVTHEFRCGQALDHACRIDRAVLTQVRDRHLEVARRGRNGTVVLRSMLERRLGTEAIVGSGFERTTLNLIVGAGLPEPKCQHKVSDGSFVAYLDLAWPHWMIGIECDSLAHHFGEHAHQWDRTRRRRLKQLGWDVREFTYEDVRDEPAAVLADLRDAIAKAKARLPQVAPTPHSERAH